MPDKILTTGQVAKMTGHSPRTVVSWFNQGIIKGYIIPGSQDRRISERSVVKMAEVAGMKLNKLEPRKCRKSATKPSPNSPTES